MNRLFLLLSTVLLVAPAYAGRDRADKADRDDNGDDAVLPYGEESSDPEKKYAPKKSGKRKAEHLREEDEEEKEGEDTLTHLDDSNLGIGGEVFSGVMLLQGSRGGVDPQFSLGVRITWEFGRLIADEQLREMFFADVQWQFAATSDGTAAVTSKSTYHDFTVAPAFCLPFGDKSPIAAYAQLGVGFNADFSSILVNKNETTLTGTKFLFQYGLGLRGRPAITDDGSVRFVFRIEVTRYLRGYMSDTFIGGGVGLIF